MMRPRSTTVLSVAVVLLAVIGMVAGLGESQSASATPLARQSVRGSGKPEASTARLSRSVIRLLNHQRAAYGLGPLHRNAKLDRAARWQSRDMVSHGYFDHQRSGGPSLVQRIRRTGYLRGARAWAVGENIAWGEGPFSTSKSLVTAWMGSPGHRANILNRRYREIGIGLRFGTPQHSSEGDAVTVTTDFGTRR